MKLICKVSHSSGGRPFMFIPDRKRNPKIPESGTLVLAHVEGRAENWIVKIVKIAINVAYPSGGSKKNKLPELLREWFGPNAGANGTQHRVTLERRGGIWTMRPVRPAMDGDDTKPRAASQGAPAAHITPIVLGARYKACA